MNSTKKKIFIILSLLLSGSLFSQQWQWIKQIRGPGIYREYIGHIDSQHNIYLCGFIHLL